MPLDRIRNSFPGSHSFSKPPARLKQAPPVSSQQKLIARIRQKLAYSFDSSIQIKDKALREPALSGFRTQRFTAGLIGGNCADSAPLQFPGVQARAGRLRSTRKDHPPISVFASKRAALHVRAACFGGCGGAFAQRLMPDRRFRCTCFSDSLHNTSGRKARPAPCLAGPQARTARRTAKCARTASR